MRALLDVNVLIGQVRTDRDPPRAFVVSQATPDSVAVGAVAFAAEDVVDLNGVHRRRPSYAAHSASIG